jgi:hypothetical protein
MKRFEDTLKFKIEQIWYRCIRPLRLFYRMHIKRLHMLDMRSKMHGFDGGYVDPSEQVLYANFSILKNFVEREKPFEFYGLQINNGKVVGQDGEVDPDIPYYQEIYDLYEWWTHSRKMECNTLSELGARVTYHMEETESEDPKYGKYFEIKWKGPYREWTDAQQAFDEKDDEMLLRVIKVRRQLWT